MTVPILLQQNTERPLSLISSRANLDVMFKHFQDEKCCCEAQHLFSLWSIYSGNSSWSVQSQHPVSNNCS